MHLAYNKYDFPETPLPHICQLICLLFIPDQVQNPPEFSIPEQDLGVYAEPDSSTFSDLVQPTESDSSTFSDIVQPTESDSSTFSDLVQPTDPTQSTPSAAKQDTSEYSG